MKLSECNKCQLCEKRANVVPGIGTGNSGIMLIGEAPGRDENLNGIPIIGQAGQLLRRVIPLFYPGKIEDVYITNTVKCWPGEGNPTPTRDQMLACAAWLDLEIKQIKPSVIVPLGQTALSRLDETAEIGTSRGMASWSERYETVVFAMYHPSYIIKNQKRLEAEFQDNAMRLGNMLHRPWREVQRWLLTTLR